MKRWRIPEIMGRAWWEWLFLAAVAFYVIGEWIHPTPRARAGDPCGPNHHWVYVQSWPDAELSCERDRD
jgi:hypothetical protein